MVNPIDTLKKLKGRSWTELRARSEQALSVYSEQIGIGAKLPSDREFAQLLNRAHFGKGKITPEILFERFFEMSADRFFPSFLDTARTTQLFRDNFRGKPVAHIIERAEKIIEGKFDLLGYLNLDFGTAIDWHYEPVSGKHLPLKHWKQFDELDSEESGDKKIIWEINRHQHFFTLGVAYQLTGEERYAATFARHLESWMAQNPPGYGVNWMSSLEVAFRSISWIWSFHFFRGSHSLTPELFQEALKFLYQHGRHLEKYLSTYYSPNTHLTGEALGLFYLGTQLGIFERAEKWRALGEEILVSQLDRQVQEDGVYFEQSTWYQRYTADFYTHFLILQALSGTQCEDELQQNIETKVQSMFSYLMHITRPDGTTPIIGDDDGGRCLPLSSSASNDFRGSLATAAVLFDRGDYKFTARDLTEETLWLLGEDGVDAFVNLHASRPRQTSRAFANGGYFLMRDGWEPTDNYLLVDGGEVGALSGGHGHSDALAIEAAIGGKTLLVDSGTYTYHESAELRNYFRTTAAHNTLMIDDRSQSEPGGKFSWKSRANTTVHSWIAEERFDFFEGSHDGYERLDEPATHRRSILNLKNDYWIMRDYVETSGTHDYALNFHFNKETNPSIEDTESGVLCVGETPAKGDGWRLFTFGDNGGWQRKESWISDNYGKRVNAPFLRYVSKGTGAQEFFTFCLPADAGFAKPEIFETTVAGGRAFVINYRGYWDVFVFADEYDQIVRTELFSTNFRFCWARLGQGEQIPEEFVMVGGTNFALGSREVINYPTELKFAVARRLGTRLNVRTSESIFSVSLPQKKPSTFILKSPDFS
ncbi:MAG: alginate lyase family protein [Acidobacteria bacterium]|nr:alginate lyase family protein [Acidobacteriota bacterium]MBK8147757.1 alginate lyase family protein [Acidobacteriota bacterium]MBK8812045.1 alginate lyase family protein [Acidobacteriota bacterium]